MNYIFNYYEKYHNFIHVFILSFVELNKYIEYEKTPFS